MKGEVLVAGGSKDSSVFIYSPVTDTWRREKDLPSGLTNYKNPSLHLWNRIPILLGHDSDKIWELSAGGGRWQLMDSNLGAVFRGGRDLAVLVPAATYKCP